MVGQPQVDKTTFIRLDNAAIIELITSTASALSTRGLVSTKFSDELRITLSGIQTSDAGEPVIIELIKQNSEFLNILTTRFGDVGFSLNVLRHTLRGTLLNTLTSLAEWGSALIGKSELFFNRSFYLYTDGECQRQVLLSKILVDKAEMLSQSCSGLEAIRKELSLMNPSDMICLEKEDLDVDEEIAKAVSFDGLLDSAITGHIESGAQASLSHIFTTIAGLCVDFNSHLSQNLTKKKNLTFDVICDSFKAEISRFSSLTLPSSSDVSEWEIRRQNLLHSLSNINQMISSLSKITLESIDQLKSSKTEAILSKSVNRRVAFDLMVAGTAPNNSVKAADDLMGYLRKNEIEPRQMLTGELSRVNQHLLPRSLELLQRVADDDQLMHGSEEQKSRILLLIKKLREHFSGFVTLSVVLLALGFTSVGCGRKLNPISHIIEPRPDVPFHEINPSTAIPPKKIADPIKSEKPKLHSPDEDLHESKNNR